MKVKVLTYNSYNNCEERWHNYYAIYTIIYICSENTFDDGFEDVMVVLLNNAVLIIVICDKNAMISKYHHHHHEKSDD